MNFHEVICKMVLTCEGRYKLACKCEENVMTRISVNKQNGF